MSSKEKLLNLHKKHDLECRSTLKKTATQAVYGNGNPHAKIMLIGEAPGKKEDLTGVPFVGASGKFLDEMLESIGLKRGDVYITNIVKYRPPANRDPSPREKKECEEWLRAEIDLIDPLLIVTLGRHALNYFFPEEKISRIHGKILSSSKKFGKGKQFYLPLYHPAVALYNSKFRSELMKDFAQINIKIKNLS